MQKVAAHRLALHNIHQHFNGKLLAHKPVIYGNIIHPTNGLPYYKVITFAIGIRGVQAGVGCIPIFSLCIQLQRYFFSLCIYNYQHIDGARAIGPAITVHPRPHKKRKRRSETSGSFLFGPLSVLNLIFFSFHRLFTFEI
jgi:hypothetical protein